MSTEVDYARRHVRFGWWSLLCFATFGLALESLHAFKVRAYLDVSNETRRLMWTLAHTHGTLLSIVHVIFGLYIRGLPQKSSQHQRLISVCLIAAGVILPTGFFLGGVGFYGGDPGVGVLLVPVGAALLLTSLFLVARGTMLVESSKQIPPNGSSRSHAKTGRGAALSP